MAGFAGSPTLKVSTIARTLRAQGRDVVDFGSGEPDFDTPEHIKQAAVKALHEGFTKYTTPSGIDELKDAIVDKLKRDNGLLYRREQVVVSCGAKHTLHNLAQVLFDPGDEVILPSPYWTTYETIIQMAEAVPVIIPTAEHEGFRVSLETLERRLTPRTKAIMLNSPSNPTGSMYRHDELAAIAMLAMAHDIYVIADDIYEKIIFDGRVQTSIIELMQEAPQLGILVNGFSKTYAMTGWRLGYAAGPREIVAAMGNYQSQTTSNPTSFVQKAGIEDLRGSQEAVGLMVQEFEQRRNYVVERLNAIEGLSCFRPMGRLRLSQRQWHLRQAQCFRSDRRFHQLCRASVADGRRRRGARCGVWRRSLHPSLLCHLYGPVARWLGSDGAIRQRITGLVSGSAVWEASRRPHRPL
jgi:aspartate aminotransferase